MVTGRVVERVSRLGIRSPRFRRAVRLCGAVGLTASSEHALGGRLIDWRRGHALVCPEWPRWAEGKGLRLDERGALLYPNETGPYEPRIRAEGRGRRRVRRGRRDRARAAHRPDAGAGRGPRAGRAVLERSSSARDPRAHRLLAGAVLRRDRPVGLFLAIRKSPLTRRYRGALVIGVVLGVRAGPGRADAGAQRRSAGRQPALPVRRVGHPDAAAGRVATSSTRSSRAPLAFGLASLFIAGLAIRAITTGWPTVSSASCWRAVAASSSL